MIPEYEHSAEYVGSGREYYNVHRIALDQDIFYCSLENNKQPYLSIAGYELPGGTASEMLDFSQALLSICKGEPLPVENSAFFGSVYLANGCTDGDVTLSIFYHLEYEEAIYLKNLYFSQDICQKIATQLQAVITQGVS